MVISAGVANLEWLVADGAAGVTDRGRQRIRVEFPVRPKTSAYQAIFDQMTGTEGAAAVRAITPAAGDDIYLFLL